MNAFRKEDPPDVSELDRPVPPALERIARRCLEKSGYRVRTASDPASDPPTGAELGMAPDDPDAPIKGKSASARKPK